MSDQTSFRHWLRQRRKEYDLTQEKLAERVGCSVVTIRRIEQGTLRPSRQLAELMATGFDIPPREQLAFVQWARTDLLKSPGSATENHTSSRNAREADTCAVPDDVVNPYKGLRAFQEADAHDFFGREILTAQLISCLNERNGARDGNGKDFTRFLAVVGPSGSGKSSVVRAGMLPALRRSGLPGGAHPLVVDIVPGTHPLEELEAALLRVAVNPPPSLREQLQADERGLLRAAKRVLPAPGNDGDTECLLVLDQFEELFTLVPDASVRIQFIDLLYTAVTDPCSRLWVIATLRADFYDRPLFYERSSELLRKRTEVVGPMSPDEIHLAIVGPAERVGLTLEPDLVSVIQQDVAEQPGALPLLQYALTELFERRAGRVMTLAAYRGTGGVVGALARRAEAIYEGLNKTEQEETRQLFLRLTTPGEGVEDTKRRVRRMELASAARDEEALDRVLDTLGRYRLLTFDRDPVTRGPTVEVAHEALIRTWPRLREWLDASRANLRTQRQLHAASSEWAEAARDHSFLAAGARLAQFEGLAEAVYGPDGLALTVEEGEYLAASIEERDRQERLDRERQAKELVLQKRAASSLRYLVAGLAVFLVIAAILSAWALNESRVAQDNAQTAQANAEEAKTQRQIAQNNAATAVTNENQAQTNFRRSEAQRFAAEANSLFQAGGSSVLIGLLSIRSLNNEYTQQGDQALMNATTLNYPLRTFVGHSAEVSDVTFSPDGEYVATAGWDGTARVWEAATGKQVRSFLGPTQVHEVVFSPDGKFLLVASPSEVRRHSGPWDVAAGQKVLEFSQHGGGWAAAYSPDGRYVVLGSSSAMEAQAQWSAALMDATTGQEVGVFSGHTNYLSINGLAFSPNGKHIATGSWDQTARLWDVETGKELRQFTGHTGWVQSVAFSPDGKLLLTASTDGSMRTWDIGTGQETHRFNIESVWNDAMFSPDGRYIAVGGAGSAAGAAGVALLVDAQTGAELGRYTGHDAEIASLGFSQDGRYLLTGSVDGTAKLWDLSAIASAPRYAGHAAIITSGAYSPDGKYLLTGSDDKTARLWDAATGVELRQFVGHTAAVKVVVFSPDGKHALTGSDDKTARLWDISTGKELSRLSGHVEGLTSVAFSPDGRMLLTSSFDSTVRIWDALTGQVAHSISVTAAAAHPPTVASFSPDGSQIMVSKTSAETQGVSVGLWDAQSGSQLRALPGHGYRVRWSLFMPDGESALIGGDNGSVELWDLSDGHVIRRFAGHTDLIDFMALSQDGRLLLTSSYDGTARLWETATGREVRRFALPRDSLGVVAYSSDGKWVLTSLLDNTAWAYRADYQDAMSDLCSRIDRDFTDQERAEYEIKENEPTCPK